jgi:hypothetical protein
MLAGRPFIPVWRCRSWTRSGSRWPTRHAVSTWEERLNKRGRRRRPNKGKVEVVTLPTATIGRATFAPYCRIYMPPATTGMAALSTWHALPDLKADRLAC